LDGKTISGGKVTTLSEYSIVSENRLTPIPEDTPEDFAALLGCCLTTSFGVIRKEAKLKVGESVAVLGCGGIGLGVIWAAKLAGAREILGFDSHPEKQILSRNVGADVFVNSIAGNTHDTLESLDLKTGFDVVIDTTGNGDVIANGSSLLADGGRLILVSQPSAGVPILIPNANDFFGQSGKSIISTQGGRTNPDLDIPYLLEILRDTGSEYRTLITHQVTLSEVNDAIKYLRNGSAGRIMVNIAG
jgi:Zn-dependent alcohol dehydrogenase